MVKPTRRRPTTEMDSRIFADEGGVEGEIAADGGAGDELGAGGLEVAEVAVVAGHPAEGGLGDGGFGGALHIEKTLSRRGYREILL